MADYKSSSNARRRGSVSAEPVSVERFAKWKGPPVHKKSGKDFARIKDTISGSSALQVLFGHLSGNDVDKVCGAFFQRKVQAGDTVISQGDDGDYFYIVDSGSFDIFVQRSADQKPDNVMTATSGMSFGELALMYNVPRAACIICAAAGNLWCLERESFQMMIITSENSKKREYEGFLGQVDVLKSLNQYELATLSDLLEAELFDVGDRIVEQGEDGDCVFFLYEGTCTATISGPQGIVEAKQYSKAGECFGEIALIKDEPRRATVTAAGGGCVVLRLKREDVDLSIGALRERLLAKADMYEEYKDLVS